MALFCSLLPGHSELYHYHLLCIHGPYIYIWSEVWTCYFLKEMVCAFLGIPCFASSWDDITWRSVCTTGRCDLLKACTVSYLSERAASCTRIGEETHLKWLIFPKHCQDSFLSSLFHFILFNWACNWTVLSPLLHFWFLHIFTTAHFSHICFLQLSVSSGDQTISISNCRA